MVIQKNSSPTHKHNKLINKNIIKGSYSYMGNVYKKFEQA